MVSCWVSQVGSCVGPTAGVLPRPCSCQGGLIAEPVMNLLPARDWLRPSDAVALRTAGWIELVIGVVLLVLLTWRFVARGPGERSQ